MDTIYRGRGNFRKCEYDVFITNEGVKPKHLPPRNNLRNHSPDGIAWGYAGSGPAQLALALLADATGDDNLALKYYQRFKRERVSTLPEKWDMPISEITHWVRECEKEPANG